MKLLYGLTKEQMKEVYLNYLRYLTKDKLVEFICDNDYLVAHGNTDLSDSELEEVTDNLLCFVVSNISYGLDWDKVTANAIDNVVAKRPKNNTQFAKTLAVYGLKVNDVFQVANVQGYGKTLYMFDESGCLCYYNFASKTFQWCAYDLANFLIRVSPENIVHTSLEVALQSKEKGEDLLADTLKMIGLKTNQGFLVDDDEYRGTTFYFDSFGDIYTNGEDEDVYHEYLTLGRILTQYHDKIIPMDKEV